MRIVLDTNVLVSGIFFAGPPGRVLDAWAADRVVLVASPEILSGDKDLLEVSGHEGLRVLKPPFWSNTYMSSSMGRERPN